MIKMDAPFHYGHTGFYFRDSEADMRKKMIEEDLVECVIGLRAQFVLQLAHGSLLVDYHNK
jgi:hypothetical protein